MSFFNHDEIDKIVEEPIISVKESNRIISGSDDEDPLPGSSNHGGHFVQQLPATSETSGQPAMALPQPGPSSSSAPPTLPSSSAPQLWSPALLAQMDATASSSQSQPMMQDVDMLEDMKDVMEATLPTESAHLTCSADMAKNEDVNVIPLVANSGRPVLPKQPLGKKPQKKRTAETEQNEGHSSGAAFTTGGGARMSDFSRPSTSQRKRDVPAASGTTSTSESGQPSRRVKVARNSKVDFISVVTPSGGILFTVQQLAKIQLLMNRAATGQNEGAASTLGEGIWDSFFKIRFRSQNNKYVAAAAGTTSTSESDQPSRRVNVARNSKVDFISVVTPSGGILLPVQQLAKSPLLMNRAATGQNEGGASTSGEGIWDSFFTIPLTSQMGQTEKELMEAIISTLEPESTSLACKVDLALNGAIDYVSQMTAFRKFEFPMQFPESEPQSEDTAATQQNEGHSSRAAFTTRGEARMPDFSFPSTSQGGTSGRLGPETARREGATRTTFSLQGSISCFLDSREGSCNKCCRMRLHVTSRSSLLKRKMTDTSEAQASTSGDLGNSEPGPSSRPPTFNAATPSHFPPTTSAPLSSVNQWGHPALKKRMVRTQDVQKVKSKKMKSHVMDASAVL